MVVALGVTYKWELLFTERLEQEAVVVCYCTYAEDRTAFKIVKGALN